jgi:hypothetical protein
MDTDDWSAVLATFRTMRPAVVQDAWLGLPILADQLDDMATPHSREAADAIRYWLDVSTNVRMRDKEWDEWYTRVISKYGALKILDNNGDTQLGGRVCYYMTHAFFRGRVDYRVFQNNPLVSLHFAKFNWGMMEILRNGNLRNIVDLTLDFDFSDDIVNVGVVRAVEVIDAPQLQELHLVATAREHDMLKGMSSVALMDNKKIPKPIKVTWNGSQI